MANKNKQRGKYFENKVAEQLRTIFNLNKHQCYRSSFSGARTTVEFGDITFSEYEKYPLIVECKYYQDMKLDDFFPDCNSYIEQWIEQVRQEKDRYVKSFNKIPLVLIIAGRPHLTNNYIFIENDDKELNSFISSIESIQQYIKCYSTKFDRIFTVIGSNNLEELIRNCLLFSII